MKREELKIEELPELDDDLDMESCDCCGHQSDEPSDFYDTNGDGDFNEQHKLYNLLCEDCYDELKYVTFTKDECAVIHAVFQEAIKKETNGSIIWIMLNQIINKTK